MKTDYLMHKLVKTLEQKGFILHWYKAITTDSCYIKLDFGVANSIRVSNHKGKEKYHYRFNLMLNINKSYVSDDGRSNFYCANDFDKMVNDIVQFKNDQLEKYGFKYYEYMLNKKKEINDTKSSWKHAKNNDIDNIPGI